MTNKTVCVSAGLLLAACNATIPTSELPDELSLVPNPEAPAAVRDEYGQFVSRWSCKGYSRQQDGSWQAGPGRASWHWYYVMDGQAIHDVWVPSMTNTGGAVGIDLRTYDPETGKWQMVWATGRQPDFDLFSATMQAGEIVMRGEIPARGQRPEHLSKITFHKIESDRLKWKYEFSPPGDGQNWIEASRLESERKS